MRSCEVYWWWYTSNQDGGKETAGPKEKMELGRVLLQPHWRGGRVLLTPLPSLQLVAERMSLAGKIG